MGVTPRAYAGGKHVSYRLLPDPRHGAGEAGMLRGEEGVNGEEPGRQKQRRDTSCGPSDWPRPPGPLAAGDSPGGPFA
jgi:hypothetical protein